ncbi:MAG TPA: M90 family metallopeptidase, partial [Ramlibacter sp.]|nr:M90 family metallopeptidase [Ramlibacter sp.]
MFSWIRKRSPERSIPEALWHDLSQRYPFLFDRSEPEVVQLKALTSRFLATKEFHGANGFVITDPVALAIAAQAVLPVLHLGLGWYDDFVGIVVHPDEVLARRTLTDEVGVVHHYDEILSGEAMEGGPVTLSWRDVEGAGASAEEGYNVVIHEFVHKIDMRDGEPDGCPPLPSRAAREAWQKLMLAEYEAFREKVIIADRFGGATPWLDPYGAEAIDEFFAVACEAYFV